MKMSGKIPLSLKGRERSTLPPLAQTTLDALASRNAHEKDSHVEFVEEGHKYFIDGQRTQISCTESVKMYFPEFDKERAAFFKMRGKAYAEGSCPEAGMTKKEIIAYWSNNSGNEEGTELHAIIEFLINARSIGNEDEFDLEESTVTSEVAKFDMFWNELCTPSTNIKNPLIPFRTEWLVYHEMLAGSIDALFESNGPMPKLPNINRCYGDEQPERFIEGERRFHLLDWKRSKAIKIKSGGGKKDISFIPDTEIPNCNFFHYTLQLNIYRILVESYGYKVATMMLVVMHPNTEGYRCYTVPFMEWEARYIINNALDKKRGIANGENVTDTNSKDVSSFKNVPNKMQTAAKGRPLTVTAKPSKPRRGIEIPQTGWTSAC